MNRTLARTTVVFALALSLLALPSAASARPTLWGGGGFNDLGPASALLNVQNGRASITNVQLILACTDTEDGTESSRAFDARFRNRVSLNRNRFSFDFSALSNGRLGQVHVTGKLGSNGRGYAVVEVDAVGNSDEGGVVESCSGRSRIPLRRGA
jgi:hypothetical protein